MAYISSNNNRWYCALEAAYGQVPPVTAQNRFPAVHMAVQQTVETSQRKDKTGTRTYPGAPANLRKQTQCDVTTYMSSWPGGGTAPAYGPLFQAALGGVPRFFNGGTAAAGSTSTIVAFAAAHGLAVGQAITFSGELRFVASVLDTVTVLLNAPFSVPPSAGSAIGSSVTYMPATELPSVSLFDYWTPATSVQRLLCGVAIDKLEVQVNGDYQQFAFRGMAQDVLDSSAFTIGMGQMNAFPAEPLIDNSSVATVVPGHLGQAWLGQLATRFYTLTGAKMTLSNNLDMRTREFGSTLPSAITPGVRKILLDLEIYGQDDASTVGLYQAARQRTPVGAGFQLGQTRGQLMGLFMKSVVPELPDYDDRETRLQWRFKGSQAQGLGDDELFIAFG